MYKSIVCIATIALFASCGQSVKNGSFELKGNITESKGETIYLEKLTNPKPVVVDSTTIDENGNFEFKNYTPQIGFYRIKTSPQNFAMLVLDSNDKVQLTANIKDLGNTYKVTGSPETVLFVEYNELSKKRDLRLDSLNKSFQVIMETQKMDSLKMIALTETFKAPFNSVVDEFSGKISEKIKTNSNMFASIMAIQGLDIEKFGDVYKTLDEGLTKKYPQNKDVIMFHNYINKVLATSIGQVAPEIKLPTPDGKEIALSSLKGKIVLIDFWASWCGPCRKETPNVVKAYAKFKNKGFEIYGVSLDKEKNKWVEAIAKDGITWPQVSDLQYWNSDVVKLYSIEGIPYTVLIDKEGKIIAKNLRGIDLENKLAEVLN